MTKEELIDKLEKELWEDQEEKKEWERKRPLQFVGFTNGWIQATQRIIALLREVK